MDQNNTPPANAPQNFEQDLRPHVWAKGVSGNPNGRPRKIVSKMKAVGYTKSEILETIKTLLACRIEELQATAMDTECTVLERTVAKALGDAMVKGKLDIIETLITRVYGAPKETIEASVHLTGPMQIEVINSGPPIVSNEADVTDVELIQEIIYERSE